MSKKTYVYNNETVELILDNYLDNGNTAVILKSECGDTDVISVNITWLMPGTFTADTNNHPDIEKFLTENHIAHRCGGAIPSGFCTYPIYMLEESLMDEIQA